MLSDIIKPSAISLSNIPGLTTSVYGDNGTAQSAAGVLSTLDSITLPPNSFNGNGDFVEFEYFGAFFGDADTEVNLVSGSNNLFVSGVMDPVGERWSLRGKLVRFNDDQLLSLGVLIATSVRVIDAVQNQVDFSQEIAITLKGGGTTAHSVELYAGFRQFYFQNR